MAVFSLLVLQRMALVAGGYYVGAWFGVNYTITPGSIAALRIPPTHHSTPSRVEQVLC